MVSRATCTSGTRSRLRVTRLSAAKLRPSTPSTDSSKPKKIAKRAHLFNIEIAKYTRHYNYDLISYIVGKNELIGNGVCERNGHWIDLYRYETLAFGDFTAYKDNGHLWLPEGFNDYGIINPDELQLAISEGVTFWTEHKIKDPEMKLMYRVFRNH